MKKNKIEAIIFDKDGLMINSEQINAKAFKLTMEKSGQHFPDAEEWYFQNCSGHRRDKVFKKIGSILPEDTDMSVLIKIFTDFRTQLWNTELKAKKGLIELLKFLKAEGIKMAIATSGVESDVASQFKLAGIPLNYFSSITYGFDVKEPKPHPETYKIACERLGVKPENAVAIEDSDQGVLSAHGAGMRVILVPDVKANSEEAEKLAWHKVSSLNEVIQVLTECAQK